VRGDDFVTTVVALLAAGPRVRGDDIIVPMAVPVGCGPPPRARGRHLETRGQPFAPWNTVLWRGQPAQPVECRGNVVVEDQRLLVIYGSCSSL
jgi:hypothetical protein